MKLLYISITSLWSVKWGSGRGIQAWGRVQGVRKEGEEPLTLLRALISRSPFPLYPFQEEDANVRGMLGVGWGLMLSNPRNAFISWIWCKCIQSNVIHLKIFHSEWILRGPSQNSLLIMRSWIWYRLRKTFSNNRFISVIFGGKLDLLWL